MNTTAKLLFLAFLLLATGVVSAQTASPYSRYGLGFVRTTGFSANRGFAELSGGYASTANINFTNPASYSALALTTFEIGANIDIVNIKAKDSTYRTANGSISHVAIGVPLKRGKWGMSFGLLPFSNMNYTFKQAGNDSSFGGFENIYRGFGSLYQVYVGMGAQFKGFSFGVNAGYLFGKLEYAKYALFPDSVGALNSRNISFYKVNGFIYNAGVQYRYVLKKRTRENELKQDIILTVGVFGSSQMPMRTRLTNYWERFYYATDGSTFVLDTVSSIKDARSKITLPFHIGGGFTVGNEANWLVGADFRYGNWSSFSSELNNDQLADNWRVMIGTQITPNIESRKAAGKIQIKLGGYYGQSEVMYSGQKLAEAGGTIGFGLPVWRKAIARINITGDFGSRGFNATNAITENYYRINLAFVLNDTWFIKRKFD